jgi:hypothetical protein
MLVCYMAVCALTVVSGQASELTKAELEAAVPLFLQKVIKYRPR